MGEYVCEQWTISQNRHFLWGLYFYWLCDCKAIKEILDYNGPITMICSWAQEIFAYNFSIFHCCARMIIDVDGLTRWFGSVIAEHPYVAILLHKYDVLKRPDAYDQDFVAVDGATSITPTPSASSIEIPILVSASIASCRTDPITISSQALIPITTTASSLSRDTVQSDHTLLHHSPHREFHSPLVDDKDTARSLLK